jgi:dephospho-CoA kinase
MTGVRGTRVARVALTGGIATGKSHVRGLFARLGVPTIDADVLARDAVLPGSPGLAAVVQRFGPSILDETGALNRRALASLVFSDPSARHALEAIVHPEVRRGTEQWFAGLDPEAHPLAIADIPLLFETGRDRDFDATIVTACDPATQMQRVMERDGLSEHQARQRIAAQLPLDEKIRHADYVIRTDGTYEDTEAEVRRVYDQLLRET